MEICDGHVLHSMGLALGGIAKMEMKKVLFYGGLFTAVQGCFVNRKSPTSRQDSLDAIKHRADLAQVTSMAPLGIFPEGTVSNGRVLLTFKKGAFFTKCPIKVLCVRYEFGPDGFSYYNGSMRSADLFVMYFSRLDCKGITVYEFDDLFDPTYLNIDPNDEDGWEIYAEKVRKIMG